MTVECIYIRVHLCRKDGSHTKASSTFSCRTTKWTTVLSIACQSTKNHLDKCFWTFSKYVVPFECCQFVRLYCIWLWAECFKTKNAASYGQRRCPRVELYQQLVGKGNVDAAQSLQLSYSVHTVLLKTIPKPKLHLQNHFTQTYCYRTYT